MPSPPITGLHVMEIADRIAGAYCGKLLRDVGSSVTMLEPPSGRRSRSAGGPYGLPLFQFLNGGKRSVVLDGSGAKPDWSGADVIVVQATPARALAAGLDVNALLAADPRLIVATISDFGWTGPWVDRPATEFTLQAMCGAIGYRGVPEKPPVSVGGRIGEYVGGVFAAAGILALRRRVDAGGPGGRLDVSLLECMTLAMQSYEWLHATLMLLDGYHRSIEVPSIEPAKDGWVGVSMVTGQQWLDFAAMVEQPALADEPDLRVQLGRWPRRQEVYKLIHPWFAARTVEEVVETASLYRIPMAPIGNGASVVTMDHFVERGVFVANPAGFLQPRPPWAMSTAAPEAPAAPPPLGASDGREPARADRSAVPVDGPVRRPLAGLRVIDLTAFWAGPAATAILAGLGADVVKIESVQRPDGIRFAGGQRPDADAWWEYSWVFHGVNVDKRSVTLDLGDPEGRATLLDLVAQADVVIENYSPRVLDGFELTPDVLLGVNPSAVVVRMPAFGLDGPWRDRVGFAPTMEQLSGMAWLTGHPDGPPMAPRGVCDPLAGAHAAFVVLAALEHRDRTGKGMLVEVPMIEVALNVTAEQMLEYQCRGELMEREGNRARHAAPQNVYACAGDEQWVALAVEDDEQWRALCGVVDQPAWRDDPSLTTAAGRRLHHDLLDTELGAWCAARSRSDAVAALVAAGVPAAAVVLPPEVVENEQLRARGFFEELDHPVSGRDQYAGLPYGPPDVGARWWRSHPPLLGEHNLDVLRDELGCPPQTLADWEERHIIGTRPLGL
jgi:crotonobetainyl-CoA:carnitine CoA-transferase CaiB-like acyl-CoA transferase